MSVVIDISLKDVIWRLDHPDEVPEHIDFLHLMWIDEFISIWREHLETINE